MKKETFRILFFINKSSLKNNGLATVMIRITINGATTQFSSKLEVNPEAWDQKSQRAIAEPYMYMNQEIVNIRNKIQKIYFDLSHKFQYVSTLRLKQSYLSNNREMYITYQFEQQLKIFRTPEGRPISSNTKSIYVRTLNRLLSFLKKKYKKVDILIYEIDYSFLEEYYSFLRREYSISHNSASKYMKKFAAIMNYAHKIKLLQVNPFDLYTFREEKTYKPCLTEPEVELIAGKILSIGRLDRIRDIFIFCCYTGLSFSDVFKIKLSDLEDRGDNYWLIFPRIKTGILSEIPLIDIPMKIIKKYHSKFPKTKNRDIPIFEKLSNQKTNAYLKEIADVCGISKNLTFHIARRTFATMALDNDVSIESISKMLGHSSIRTTERYITISNVKVGREMKVFSKRLQRKRKEKTKVKNKLLS